MPQPFSFQVASPDEREDEFSGGLVPAVQIKPVQLRVASVRSRAVRLLPSENP